MPSILSHFGLVVICNPRNLSFDSGIEKFDGVDPVIIWRRVLRNFNFERITGPQQPPFENQDTICTIQQHGGGVTIGNALE
jgi:hypothetical protein